MPPTMAAFRLRYWAGRDSNPRRYKPSDLQSDAIGRSATCPSLSQLSYRWELNPQPPVYKTGALPLSYGSANSLGETSCSPNATQSLRGPLNGHPWRSVSIGSWRNRCKRTSRHKWGKGTALRRFHPSAVNPQSQDTRSYTGVRCDWDHDHRRFHEFGALFRLPS
jgi:hypothetical protein